MRRTLMLLGLSLVAFVFTSCEMKADFGEIEAKLKKIEKNQDKILAGIEAIKKKGPAAAKPDRRKGRPDPNKVYSVPVGEAFQKGPSTAKVTIIESTEFQ